MKPASPYYKPKSIYIESLDSWSKPKWHKRKQIQDTLFDGMDGQYTDRTICGTIVKHNGIFAEHEPVITANFCKKCFK